MEEDLEIGEDTESNHGGDWFDFSSSEFYGPVTGKIENRNYAAPRPRATWPYQVGTMPPQAGYFQSRRQVDQLADALSGGGSAALSQPSPTGVVVGLGGVGKTQLAARYARAAWQSGALDVLVWISPATTTSVIAGYAQAAT